MIAVLHFRPSETYEAFLEQGRAALAVLADRPGFVRGNFGRSTDDEDAWALVTEWESVGAYRRALGGYEVKLIATPLMSQALDQPSAFEILVAAAANGPLVTRQSDRAPDADWTARTVGDPSDR